MVRVRLVGGTLAVILCMCLLPASASAQATTASGIAGVVRDTSGAVLPGVTVEASSPALIEKARIVVTDGEGPVQHRRSAARHVCRSPSRCPGFRTFRRDGIVLHGGVHGDGQRRHAGRDARGDDHGDRRSAAGRHAERPQADRHVGRDAQRAAEQREEPEQPRDADAGFQGNEGFDVTGGYTGQVGGTYHGKARHQGAVRRHEHPACGGEPGLQPEPGTVQETVLSTSGISAESNADGVADQHDPEGGRQHLLGQRCGLYSGESLQSDNLSDELRARGLTTVTSVNYDLDAGTTSAARSSRTGCGSSPRSGNGATTAGRRQVLQQDAGHAVLHAGSRPAGVHARVDGVQGASA